MMILTRARGFRTHFAAKTRAKRVAAFVLQDSHVEGKIDHAISSALEALPNVRSVGFFGLPKAITVTADRHSGRVFLTVVQTVRLEGPDVQGDTYPRIHWTTNFILDHERPSTTLDKPMALRTALESLDLLVTRRNASA